MLTKEKLKSIIDPSELAQELLGADVVGGKMRCINPEHEDKNPSMQINDDHLFCWSCKDQRKSRWDIFDIASLHLEKQGKPHSFRDTMKFLADMAGIEYRPFKKHDSKLDDLMSMAYEETEAMLTRGKHKQVLAYLHKRGITDPDVIRSIGVAPSLGKSKPFGKDTSAWYNPMQRDGAIAFPMKNSKGNLVNIKFRLATLSVSGDIEKDIKTLTSGEGFFGNHQCERPVVVEGELDALHLMQVFGDNVISTGGAGSPMREVHNIRADNYLVIPDNDDVDEKTGVSKGYEVPHKLASLGSFVQVCQIPREYKDVELFIQSGADILDYLKSNMEQYGSFLARWRVEAKKYLSFLPGRQYEETTWQKARELKTMEDKTSFCDTLSKLTSIDTGELKDRMKPKVEKRSSRILSEVTSIRSSDLPKPEQYDLIISTIFRYLSGIGSWLRDGGTPYIVVDGKLLKITSSESGAMFQSMLYDLARINPVSSEGKHVISGIRMLALNEAVQIAYRGNTFCDRNHNIMYVGIDEGKVLKITPGRVEGCRNGDMGNFIFWPTNYNGFEYDGGSNKVDALAFIRNEIMDYVPVQPEMRSLVAGYMLASYFRDYIHGQRGILHLTGDHGAGKTSAASQFGLLFFGDDLNRGRVTMPSLISAASVEPALILDNWEHHNITEAKAQFLLTSTTGASNMKRKANTEREVTIENPNAMLVVTSIESWGSPEIKSRMLSIEASDKFKKEKRIVVAQRRDLILSNRSMVMSGLLKFFAEDIMPAFKNGRWRDIMSSWNKIGTEYKISKHRVLPVIALAAMIVSEAHKSYPDFCDDPVELAKFWRDYICIEDKKDRLESNIFTEYLEALPLLSREKTLLKQIDGNTWEGTASQFLAAFMQIDRIQNRNPGFPYKSAMSLAKRANYAKNEIAETGFTFEKVGNKSGNGVAVWRAIVPDISISYTEALSLVS